MAGILCAFQSENNLFYVMEFLSGGDLYFHLEYYGRFTREITVFYAAEIFLAVNFLHRNKVIHRDIKPGTNDKLFLSPRVKLFLSLYLYLSLMP